MYESSETRDRELGRDLVLTIRIAPDGTLYFHDLPLDLIAVARAMCPEDRSLQARAQAARLLQKDTR